MICGNKYQKFVCNSSTSGLFFAFLIFGFSIVPQALAEGDLQ